MFLDSEAKPITHPLRGAKWDDIYLYRHILHEKARLDAHRPVDPHIIALYKKMKSIGCNTKHMNLSVDICSTIIYAHKYLFIYRIII